MIDLNNLNSEYVGKDVWGICDCGYKQIFEPHNNFKIPCFPDTKNHQLNTVFICPNCSKEYSTIKGIECVTYKDKNTGNTENSIAKVLKIIGIVEIIAGFIMGMILMNSTSEVDHQTVNISVFFTWTIGGVISGMIFLGLAEIINKLHSIDVKLGKTIVENKTKEFYSTNNGNLLMSDEK